jgi:peptide/nickel transport system substrate-binding protein/oligopeptide transport system substrate-binding protein
MQRVTVLVAVFLAAAALFFILATTSGEQTNGKRILRLAIDSEPGTLDPIGITDTTSDGVARKIHNGLVRFKRHGDPPDQKLEIVPDLAKSWEISPDGRTYTFHLRKGIYFHNGREMSAGDAVYSLTRLLSPESKRPTWLMPMVVGSYERYHDKTQSAPVGIKALDDYTLEIKLVAPFAPFLQHLCTVNCSIIPREAVEDKSRQFARFPVGVGAFKLTHRRDNERLVLERNDRYFRGQPKLDAIHFLIIKDLNLSFKKYFAGELHATSIPYGHMKEAEQRAGDQILRYQTLRTNYIGIGMPNGKFTGLACLKPFGTNAELRHALSYALDRHYLCETVLEGRGMPAKGILPPDMPGFKPGRPGWPHDLEKAKALLTKAGYPEGRGLPPMTLLYKNDPDMKRVVQVVARDFEKIGLRVSLQAQDWNAFRTNLERQPGQMFFLGWVADYPDPDNFLYVLFHSSQFGKPGNKVWYSNPEVDELTERGRRSTKKEERLRLYQQVEDILLKDCAWIVAYHVRNVVLIRKDVTGIRENYTALDTGTEFPQVDFALVDIVE